MHPLAAKHDVSCIKMSDHPVTMDASDCSDLVFLCEKSEILTLTEICYFLMKIIYQITVIVYTTSVVDLQQTTSLIIKIIIIIIIIIIYFHFFY